MNTDPPAPSSSMPIAETITVSYSLSFGKQFCYGYTAFLRSGVGKVLYALFLGLPLLSVPALFTTERELRASDWAGLLIMPSIALILLPAITVLNIWQARRRNRWLRGKLVFVIDPDVFAVQGESFDVKLRWEAIRRVVETGNLFLFYVSGPVAHFIPKESLTKTDIDALRRIVREAVRNRAALKAD